METIIIKPRDEIIEYLKEDICVQVNFGKTVAGRTNIEESFEVTAISK